MEHDTRELKKTLAELYAAQPLFLDRLPYTQEFDDMMARLTHSFPDVTNRQVWLLLLNMRKVDRILPRKTSKKVHVTPGGRGNPVKGPPLPAGPSLSEMV